MSQLKNNIAAQSPRFSYDQGFIDALAKVDGALAVTADPGGLILLGTEKSSLTCSFVPMDHAWGLAASKNRLAVATRREIIVYADVLGMASSHPELPERYDGYFTPRVKFFTGDCLIHDMAIVNNGLLVSNTYFSNVSLVNGSNNFISYWTPPFISKIAPEDRCHLNGICVENSELRYVTAFGKFDTARGWRGQDSAHSGILIDARTNSVIAENLCLPHSPRLIDGKLLVLEAGCGNVQLVNAGAKSMTLLTRLPGFTRGLAGSSGIAFIGLSGLRNSPMIKRTPLMNDFDKHMTGLVAIEIQTGQVIGSLHMENKKIEIFDLAIIPGMRNAGIADTDEVNGCYVIESNAGNYWMRKAS